MSRNSFGEKKKISVFSVIEAIVIAVLVIMIAGMILCNIAFRDDSKAATIFGYSFYKTRAVNMIPEIPVNTVIIAKKSEIPNIKERSVILFTIGEYTTLTRVVEVGEDNGKTYYIVKFDTASANETFKVERDNVIAKAVWQLESFGKFLDFATSVPGIIIAVVIPLAIIIIIQIVRIKNIHDLEKEASSIDDFNDIFVSSKTEEPPPVTFTEPKFTEDVTGKIPVIKSYTREEEEKPKAKLTVDANGRADYRVEKSSPVKEDRLPAFLRPEGLAAETEKQPAAVAARPQTDGPYINPPTKIEQRPAADTFDSDIPSAAGAFAEKEEKVSFTPHLSNVIPESLANIQEQAAVNAKPNFSDSVKAYFEKSDRPVPAPEPQPDGDVTPTIPENAVVPKETIAPVKKKKSSRTLEELMSIIDSEESKLKK